MKTIRFVQVSLGIALCAVGVAILASVGVSLHRSPKESGSRAIADKVYGNLPLTFEENRGQVNRMVNHLAHGRGYELFLTPTEAVLLMRESPSVKKPKGSSASSSVLRMKLTGGKDSASAAGVDLLPGTVNYLLGNEPANWRRNIPTYRKVEYKAVYDGIDLVYYGNQQQLEYDFVVAPGRDPAVIGLEFDGPDKLQLDDQGNLVMRLGGGELRLRKPVAYQLEGGSKQLIAAAYRMSSDNRVSFQFGDYDRSKTLVIDPILVYSTFIGGSSSEGANGIAVDNAGNAYIVGTTFSADYPITPGVINPTFTRAFVTKLNRTGSALVYSTFFGAVNQFSLDEAVAVAVDGAGQAYITGNTRSPNFPVTPGAFDATCGTDGACNSNDPDAFLTVLNATGSDLVYSTFFGGSDLDGAAAITLDSSGAVYLTGSTFSTNLPVRNATQPGCGGGTFLPCVDAFVAKFITKATGNSSLVYSTFLGGNGDDRRQGIAVDKTGQTYVTGQTLSTNFPTSPGAFDTTCGDDGLCDDVNSVSPGPDAFVTAIATSGSSLVYSTYLGGHGWDIGNDVAVDSLGDAYVTGVTQSTNFPVTAGAFGQRLRGIEDAFVTIMNPTGTSPVASTLLGSNGEDVATAIAVDAKGNAYVTGNTDFDDFPVTPDRIFNFSGDEDAFVTKLDRDLTTLIYSTYLGGLEDDLATGLALGDAFPDPAGHLGPERLKTQVDTYIAGTTHSPGFPTTPGAFDRICGTDGICNDDRNDVFVAKLTLPNTATPFAAAQLDENFLIFSANVGATTAPQIVTLTSIGDTPLLIAGIAATGEGFAVTNNCGSSLAPSAQCQISITFTAAHAGVQLGQITISDNAEDSPQIIHLHGTGISTARATLSPGDINFGNQHIGTTSAPRSQTITSSGTTDLVITSVWVGEPFAQTNNCLGHPIHPGDTCTVSITYSPTETGGNYTIFQLQDNTPNFNAAQITGTGIP